MNKVNLKRNAGSMFDEIEEAGSVCNLNGVLKPLKYGHQARNASRDIQGPLTWYEVYELISSERPTRCFHVDTFRDFR